MIEKCRTCLLSQVESLSAMAGLTDDQSSLVQADAKKHIAHAQKTGRLPQQVVRAVTDDAIRILNLSQWYDLYADIKELSNTRAAACAPSMEKRIDAAPAPLIEAIKIAAGGNCIDFGVHDYRTFDLERELENIHRADFPVFHSDALRHKLSRAETLLYICDNAGEIVFDMLLIRLLIHHFPALHICAAVREKPIINDATMHDARRVGLTDTVRVISSGSVYPGTILNETTQEFQHVYHHADVIISKGQGNFETLLPAADETIFFLLRIKCSIMAELSGVEKGRAALLQGSRVEKPGEGG
jgi:uncharacterized protein with ATP-grasp and redox domains